jgi:hypothetical protein
MFLSLLNGNWCLYGSSTYGIHSNLTRKVNKRRRKSKEKRKEGEVREGGRSKRKERRKKEGLPCIWPNRRRSCELIAQ